ncbi:BA75_02444T0 [Komagataella pastoris]|uniref:BA75_02444T0 n=1 Tax=Komagataella pastoris TaxID=4922 RepID=A0A1B2JB68_PICPA|nr:BA75_02444T0 [Komagataella pastoris]
MNMGIDQEEDDDYTVISSCRSSKNTSSIKDIYLEDDSFLQVETVSQGSYSEIVIKEPSNRGNFTCIVDLNTKRRPLSSGSQLSNSICGSAMNRKWKESLRKLDNSDNSNIPPLKDVHIFPKFSIYAYCNSSLEDIIDCSKTQIDEYSLIDKKLQRKFLHSSQPYLALALFLAPLVISIFSLILVLSHKLDDFVGPSQVLLLNGVTWVLSLAGLVSCTTSVRIKSKPKKIHYIAILFRILAGYYDQNKLFVVDYYGDDGGFVIRRALSATT